MAKKYNILIVMVFAMILGYLPWYNFSAVSSFIQKDLNLSTREMGTILSVFQAGYVITVIFTGWLADKLGRKKVVSTATILTGVFSIMFALFAKDYAGTMFFRILTGLSAGAIYAPGIALLTNWFDKKDRGLAVGAYTAALTIAYAGGYFIASPIAASFGWRQGILWTSLPALIAGIMLILLVKENPQAIKTKTPIKLNTAKESVRNMRLSKAVITIAIIAYAGHMWELYSFWGWIGNYLSSVVYSSGVSQVEAATIGGRIAAFVILLGAPSVFFVSYLSDKLNKIKLIMIASVASILGEFAFGFLQNISQTTVILIALWIGFWAVADSGIYKVILTEFASQDKMATMLGVQSSVGFAATIVSPYVFGRVLENINKGFAVTLEYQNWGAPFMILGIGALVSPICMLYLKKLLKE
jgi:MFS family permease